MNNQQYRAGVTEAAKLFAGNRLKLARQLAGLRKVELAAQIEKTPAAITAYESGRTRPAPSTVAQLSVALGVEPGFFLATPSTMLSLSSNVIPHFRSLRTTTQLVRDQATAYGWMVHDIVQTFERYIDMPKCRIPSFPVPIDGEITSEPTAAAQELRKAWEVEKGPIPHLLRSAENNGIVVAFGPTQSASVDAYSFETPHRPIVILNPIKDDYYRQRFDLAHELGHLIMHTDAEPGGRIVELQAHQFASELLMPANEIISQLPHRLNWSQFLTLKEYWGVSMQALLYRARELGTLSDVTYRNAMIRMSKEGWRRQEPGRHPGLEQPSLLPKSLELLEGAGISAVDIAREARAPMSIFSTATARQSRTLGSVADRGDIESDSHEEPKREGEVVSLFGHHSIKG
ncbi:helix-turn-helix domain-containing protein [Streptosporangium sp. DT93]|uniref:helix-turn-helix domain-containing protein n=1 Tax=Streptosporangium sp. DT93 TaxID=3393428 RepID=UPI003CF53ECC